jgi:hypothetical protein
MGGLVYDSGEVASERLVDLFGRGGDGGLDSYSEVDALATTVRRCTTMSKVRKEMIFSSKRN